VLMKRHADARANTSDQPGADGPFAVVTGMAHCGCRCPRRRSSKFLSGRNSV